MTRTMLGCGLAVALAAHGCASAPKEGDLYRSVDRPWTAADEQAMADLARAAGETAAPLAAGEPAAIPAPAAAPPSLADAPPLLEVYVFDIGQADSMLVVGPAPARRTLLVDLGQPTRDSRLPPGLASSAAHVLTRIQELTGRSGVDYFVLSHYHSDHAGFGAGPQEGWGTGVIGLLSDFSVPFSVGEFIHVGAAGAEFMAPSERRGVFTTIQRRMPLWIQRGRVGQSVAPQLGASQIDLGEGVTVEVLAFAGIVDDEETAFQRAMDAGVDYETTSGNENDLSIALEISAGDFELFTAGDLTGTDDADRHPLYVVRHFEERDEIYTNVEHHLASYWETSGRESDVEVYRANHHGSHYSTTDGLLDALDPELVLYSTGGDHGHPSNSVVQRAGRTARQLATTWVTDLARFRAAGGSRVGEIRILVAPDGSSYEVDGEERPCFSDAEESAGGDEAE